MQLSQSRTVKLYSGMYYFMWFLMNYFNSFDTENNENSFNWHQLCNFKSPNTLKLNGKARVIAEYHNLHVFP